MPVASYQWTKHESDKETNGQTTNNDNMTFFFNFLDDALKILKCEKYFPKETKSKYTVYMCRKKYKVRKQMEMSK